MLSLPLKQGLTEHPLAESITIDSQIGPIVRYNIQLSTFFAQGTMC